MPDSRATIVERLRKKVAAGQPIIGGGAGTGISAKCEEAGGIDLIVIYNSGRFRMAGRGSMAGLMPYGNANAIVKEMAREVLTAVRHTPVLAGVCASDPFMLRDHFLRELKDMGFAGIQNFPTVGLIDGLFRANLEETGMGFGLEIDLIAAARGLDLLTTPYAFDPEQSRLLAEAAPTSSWRTWASPPRARSAPGRPGRSTTASARWRRSPRRGSPPGPTCSSSATAGRSPIRRMPSTSSTAFPTSMVSTAPARWSGSPPRSPSRAGPRFRGADAAARLIILRDTTQAFVTSRSRGRENQETPDIPRRRLSESRAA